MTERETRVPFSERPLVKFLTLRHAMRPMPFLVAGIAANFLLKVLTLSALYGFSSESTIYLATYVVTAWINLCLCCARLLDARAFRIFATFVVLALCYGLYFLDVLVNVMAAPYAYTVIPGMSAFLFVLANLFPLCAPSSSPAARDAEERHRESMRRQLEL